ncbi:MAG: biotin--[acetyl-CoA-carboxylase] ligase [Planctomycetota bacterium]
MIKSPSKHQFDLDRIRTELTPWRLHWYPRLRSTNDRVVELKEEGKLFCPALVLTGNQTAGRGRGDNVWFSGPATLTVSFAVTADEHRRPEQLPLIVGVLVRRAIERLGADGVKIKWPNDLVHDGLKLAGILCEREHGVDVIGIGLNVGRDPALPADIARDVTSLDDIAHRELDKTDVLLTLAAALADLATRPITWSDVRDEFNAYDALGGEVVRVGETMGHCEGVDADGRLLIKGPTGTQRLHTGTARIVSPT